MHLLEISPNKKRMKVYQLQEAVLARPINFKKSFKNKTNKKLI